MRLIAEPYGDPIELMANRLAEDFMFTSSPDDEPRIFYPSPKPTQSPMSSHKSRFPLNAIPEED